MVDRRQAGSGGMRRGARRRSNRDWRYNVRGVEALFRFDDANLLSVVSGNVDSVTDMINGHVLTAPSAGQRPTWTGSGATFAAASSQILTGASALAALFGGTNVGTWIARASWSATAASYTAIGLGDSTAATPLHECVVSNVGTLRSYRAGVGSQNASGGAASTGVTYSAAATFDGTNLTAWKDGVAGTPVAGGVSMGTPDRFALGGLDRLTPADYMSGTIHEALACSVVLTASELADIHNRLAARYP